MKSAALKCRPIFSPLQELPCLASLTGSISSRTSCFWQQYSTEVLWLAFEWFCVISHIRLSIWTFLSDMLPFPHHGYSAGARGRASLPSPGQSCPSKNAKPGLPKLCTASKFALPQALEQWECPFAVALTLKVTSPSITVTAELRLRNNDLLKYN